METPAKASRLSLAQRYLDPGDRLSEVLFGLIMVLTFTLGAGLVVREGEGATRQMLVGILGCNIAWGLIDGGMYVIGNLFERGRRARLLEVLQKTDDEDVALGLVSDALDDDLEPITSEGQRRQLYRGILERVNNMAVHRIRVRREDLLGAMASFWLVFVSAIPAVLPFALVENRFLALRLSNGLLLTLLFLVGFRCGRATHGNPWAWGIALVVAGLVLVGIAMVLGG